MKRNLLILLAIFILGSCDNAENEPDCSLVLCDYVAKSLRIRYVDKTTNSPLFSQSSPYTPGDLKVTIASNPNYSPVITVDSNDPSVIIMTPLLGGEVMTLRNLPADKITMQTKSAGKGCCAGIEILSLKINEETICAPCNNLHEMIAVIEK